MCYGRLKNCVDSFSAVSGSIRSFRGAPSFVSFTNSSRSSSRSLDDGRFQRYFRLSRSQCDDLLSRVGGRISIQDTNYRHSIPPAERLSICLRYLATGDSFQTIASSFCVGVTTVCKVVPDVVTAIRDCLVEEFMAVPSTDEWRSIAEGFEERRNFLLCCGALDSKHVLIKEPPQHRIPVPQLQGNFFLSPPCCCGCKVLLPGD
ncbi:protein ANTAGONIST OF LIKE HETEROCHROMATIN PROTEIN 1-like [Cyprinus carpio]|uniref:Protein ANTAGONIST OF LIKE HETEROCHROMATIN PROTEIN 1-like n=1 Tax=Cyprinus carpio TaxID=7962 RepID=A0A9Q9YTP0_CYPCA|nr:protein ANTAGONIST OF LIKE HETEROCHROMATIN PROTEIN 1-like [Cyprinus carpio]